MKINTKNQKTIAEAYEALNAKLNSLDASKMITEAWAPMIERTTGVTDSNKLSWMSQLAHNTAKELNEASAPMIADGMNGAAGFGGVYAPYNTLYNTTGVGNPVPAGTPAMTGNDFASNQFNGSGDKYPALLPLALKVAAKTIGFELVNTIPLAGPTGVLPYMDYVYTGSKAPYGATPAFDANSANPKKFHGTKAWELYDVPSAFKAALVNTQSSTSSISDIKKALLKNGLLAGTTYKFESGAGAEAVSLEIEFAGWSRIDGKPMFKVVGANNGNLGTIFENGAVEFKAYKEGQAVSKLDMKLVGPELISMQEDQILGYAGSGKNDADPWLGTFQDGTTMFEPMRRGAGEMTSPRQISLRLFTKNIQVGTIQVGCAVTQEQVTDLQKQWGIDVVKLVENAGVAELSQTINRHITSRLFSLGWKNALKLYEVEGANLNLSFVGTDQPTPAFAYPSGQWIEADNDYERHDNASMPFVKFNQIQGAQFENRDTLIKRIYTNILAASNWIQQRGRYGGANFIVTNNTVATLLQSGAHYSFAPIENNVNQGAGQLYPIGKICGMTCYVDPIMAAYDTRILVGRKGDKEEPGTYFCPYVMAQVVRTIAEATGAPKLYIKSRYALVDAGFFPETQYFTFVVDTTGL